VGASVGWAQAPRTRVAIIKTAMNRTLFFIVSPFETFETCWQLCRVG
jgi:hypothetical protein